MQTISKNKLAIAISVFMILSMSASMIIAPGVLAQVNQVPGTHIPTDAILNVFPLIVGVGQAITVNYFVATPWKLAKTTKLHYRHRSTFWG
jgi:uncharacterized membrane protein YgaE (UPF0421/DUF939 family)